MGMSDCSGCWETPCVCADVRGYKQLSIRELTTIRDGISNLITEKLARGIDPDKREHGARLANERLK